MMVPVISTLILICIVVAQASSVDDRCSLDLPCTPSNVDSDPHFCDYQIGPTSGGYCVACEGRQTKFCDAEETGLTEAGKVDCVDKCRFKNCTKPCDEGYFCSYYNYEDGPCRPCKTSVVHPEECDIWGFRDGGTEECKDKCVPRTCSKRSHCSSVDVVQFFCNFDDLGVEGEEPMGICEVCTGMKSIEECNDRSASNMALQECTEVCEDNVLTSCITNSDCKDNFFCNINSTICQVCPSTITFGPDWHVNQCFDSMSRLGLLDDSSQNNCAEACHIECQDIREGSISVQGLVDIGKADTIPMRGTPYDSVSGSLVDCQYGEEGSCAADAPDNFICLISRGVNKFSDKAINCGDAGGIATIVYNNQENNAVLDGGLGLAIVDIPITGLSMQDGLDLLENGLGREVEVDVKLLGENCDVGCSDRVPCPSSQYCDYKLVTGGYCQECKPDEEKQRVECFLSGLPIKGAQACADTCSSTLTSGSCKICGDDLSGSSLQSAPGGEPICNFCPDGLERSHWDHEIPFIGSNATCYKLNQFFLNYELPADSSNCQLSLNFNYICDCEGEGYAGADTDAKKKALVWVPRVSGILSFLGSCAIIIDVLKDKKKKKKLYCQLMVSMSVFDLMGSVAYSLTTLPIPTEYYIEGSKGNDASCTAQGFFIQMGTTSAFLNVSLAFYYYRVIKLNHSETRIKRQRIWLFVCPIVVGLSFAFAGIPFYDMLFLWCNNTASWWPEIPIAIAIVVVTLTMISVCFHVYKTEKKSRGWSMTSSDATRQSMSSIVFWQSFWYLMSFYLTWPPYLALQYLWAAGSGYSNYGFTLFASTLVPLQGFWNSVVFFRVRMKKSLSDSVSFVSRRFSRPIISVSNISGESPDVDMNVKIGDKAEEVVQSTTVKASNRISWSDKTTEIQAYESNNSCVSVSAALGVSSSKGSSGSTPLDKEVMPEEA